jgi:STAS domain.
LEGQQIKVKKENDSMNVAKIEERLLKEVEGVIDITFYLSKLECISSAGFRMLLQMQKMMKTQGNMAVVSTNEEVMEIFKVTGVVRQLNIV